MALGDSTTDNTQATVTLFLAGNPAPTSAQIATFLQTFDASARSEAAQALIAGGAASADVLAASQFISSSSGLGFSGIWEVLAVASAGASVYHGYRRNQSIGWALWWGFIGGIFPVVTPAIAIAQGFGKKAS